MIYSKFKKRSSLQDREIFLSNLKAGKINLEEIEKDLRSYSDSEINKYKDDFEIMATLMPLLRTGDAYYLSDKSLKANKDFILLAIKLGMDAVWVGSEISKAYINDPDLFPFLIGKTIALKDLPPHLQKNEDVAIMFLENSNNNDSYYEVPLEVRTSLTFVKKCVKAGIFVNFEENGFFESLLNDPKMKSFLLDPQKSVNFTNFELLPESYKSNKALVLDFITNSKRDRYDLRTKIFQAMGTNLLKDKEFILQILDSLEIFSSNGETKNIYTLLAPNLKQDKDIVLKALSFDPELIDDLDAKVFKDSNLMLEIIRLEPMLLKRLNKSLRSDPELVKEAFKLNPKSFEFATDILKGDKKYISELFNINSEVLDYTPLKIQKDYLINEPSISVEPNEEYYRKTRENIKKDAIIIRQDGLNLFFLSHIKYTELIAFKKALFLALDWLKQTPIQGFENSTINTKIYILDLATYKTLTNDSAQSSLAWYSERLNLIFFPLDEGSIRTREHSAYTIIHELGHKFHKNNIKNGFDNQDIYDLYKIATSKTDCTLAQLPKIGDLLSELNYDHSRRKWWWIVTSSNEDFVLTKIVKNEYIYENKEGQQVSFTKGDLLKMIKCPSQYGAKDALEFFAEMTTLITTNKVKPSQRAIADKFLDIIKINLK